MAVYLDIGGATNLSLLVSKIQTDQHEPMLSFQRGTSTPTVAPVGTVWNRTDEAVYGDAWKRWNGSAWVFLLDPEYAQLNAGGTVAMAADLPAGGFKLTGLAAGSAAGHSVRYEQVMLLTGANAMSGNLAMGNNRITGLNAPTANDHAVHLGYVKEQFVYFQTNRDLRANSRPVKIDVGGVGTADFTDIGFQPRRVSLFLFGFVRRQSDNVQLGSVNNSGAGYWLHFERAETDSTGGYTAPATTPVQTINALVDVTLTWSASSPAGFKITLKQTGTGNLVKLRNSGNTVDAVIQVLAYGGPSA